MKTHSLKQQWQESGIVGRALILVTVPIAYAPLVILSVGMSIGVVIGAAMLVHWVLDPLARGVLWMIGALSR